MKIQKAVMALVLSIALTFQMIPAYAVTGEPDVTGKDSGITVNDSGKDSGEYVVKGEYWKYGLGNAMGFNENTYKTIGTTGNANWRDGSVSGNGELAFIESSDPNEDVFILNNTKIVTDETSLYATPNIANSIDRIKTGAVNKTEYPWLDIINQYAKDQFGASSWGTTWPRPYQPAAQYRIKNNDFTSANSSTYNRYTNFETGEVGVQWKDSGKTSEWNRRSFVSRSDNVIVTQMEADQNLNITLSIDDIGSMQNGPTNTTKNDPAKGITSSYFVDHDGNGYAMGMAGKYQVQNRIGDKNPEETMFAHGGWGTATRIIADGATFTQGTASDGRPTLTVTGAKSIMLISKDDRQDNGCNTVDQVKAKLYNKLIGDIDTVVSNYKAAGKFTYKDMLAPHVAIHGKTFNTAHIDLCSTDAEKADRQLTNSELIAKQNSQSTFNKAYMERAYYNGRYALLCASGYQSTRLGGIWTGMWNPDWSGDFTLDANLNLQVAGMNTGNMELCNDGYISLMLRMLPGWENHATNVYGMTDAIMAPPRTDGTGQGDAYHFLGGYPHLFVNGITDWLLIPIFEYWQCYGDRQVPLGKDVNFENIKSILELSDADVQRIKSNGYMDLEKDILFPLLDKNMNFWTQYADEKYYKDGTGKNHVNDGTTLSQAVAAGDTNAKYLFAPGYSPENTPTGGNVLAYNSTMDISAAKNSVYMAEKVLADLYPENTDKLAKWETFKSKVPTYLYNSDGALQEWADPSLKDNYSHRHTSHAYSAWPAHEAVNDPALATGVQIALDMRNSYNATAPESHAHDHRALVEARLGNASGLETPLKWLTKNNYRYTSFMTSHNNNLSSAYCTDLNDSYSGIINESLVYSYDDDIKILPALLKDLNKGSITGLRARCNTEINEIAWDKGAATASVTLTSDKDNNAIKLQCGVLWKKVSIDGVSQNVKTDDLGNSYIDLTLKKSDSVKIDFVLADTTLSSLTVNGRQLSGFSPDMYKYNMLIPDGMKLTPWVAANAKDPDANVAITQDSEMSEQATITVTNGTGKSIYTIIFNHPSGVNDDFNTDTLGSQWSWVREDPTNWNLTSNPGSMMISPRVGDVYGQTNTANNILLQNASGDFTIETKATYSIKPHVSYQQGGLVVYQDDNNYVKVGWEATGSTSSSIQLLKESGGSTTSVSIANPSISNNIIWYRIVKNGDNYTAYYSTDGTNFTSVGSVSNTLGNTKVGLYAINGSGTSTDLNILFDYFHIQNLGVLVNEKPHVSSFEDLDPSVKTQDVANGAPFSSLNLPQKLKAVVDGISGVLVNISKWISDITYNPTVAGTYSFTPVLDSGYVRDSGAILPEIKVTVESPKSTDKTISSFEELNSSVKTQAVANGTSRDSLNLPDSLKATVDGKLENISGITWSSTPNYNSTASDTYTFTAKLSSGYVLGSAISLPTITVVVAASENNNTSHHSSSSSSSNSSSNSTTTPSTMTATTNGNGGTVATISTKPDATPVVTGNHSSISVTVPADVTSVVTSATSDKPAEIKIAVPTSDIVDQLKSGSVKSVDLNIMAPAAVTDNKNVNAHIAINADPSVLQAAKEAGKDITLKVTNSDTGKEAYSWTFSGTGLKNSAAPVTNVNLALTITSVASDSAARAVVGNNTSDKKASGLVLKFGNNGLLPGVAKVRAYVGDQAGCTPGSIVFLYYLNYTTNALEQMPQSGYTIDADGYVTVTIAHCSDYVLLPKAATNPYAVKCDTTFLTSVKSGKSYTFAMTVSGNEIPSFTVGNSKAFVTNVKHIGNKYYVTVKAVGAAGITTAVYSALPKQKPAVMDYIIITK
jgi:alpha-L-fucosidase 2